MSEKERFEAFKQSMVEENEKKYGSEIREKYGDGEVDASNRKMLKMTEEEYEKFQNLAVEINTRLEAAVRKGIPADSKEMKEITVLHKEWLMMTWKQYTPEAHKGLAYMYTTDERFKTYYDKNMEGCADLLCAGIQYWA